MERIGKLATGLLLVVAATVQAAALPREQDRWIRVRTDHFTLISNASAKRTVRLGRSLERLREVLAKTSTGMSVETTRITRIYVFRNDAGFRPYKIGEDGKPQTLAGYFASSPDGNYVAVDLSAGSEPLSIIYHEYVHSWVENNAPGIPLWLNEGLAEFYSTFEVRGNVAEIGRHIDAHLQWLAAHAMIPLDRLFAADTGSADYNEESRRGTFYAQSWALTHFLLTGDDKRRSGVGRYLGLISRQEGPRSAFEKAFDLDPRAVEKELRAYVNRGSYGFLRWVFEEEIEAGEASVEPLEYVDVLFLLGDLLAHNPPVQFDAAEEHMRAVLARDEDYAAAYATLGFLNGLQQDHEAAERFFRKAIGLNEEDPRFHWLYGRSLLTRFIDSIATPTVELFDETPPLLLAARREFQRSLELDPDQAPSLAGLGKTWVYERDPAPGIDALTRAYWAAPSRTDLLLDLIVVTANSGDTPGARRLLDRLLRPRGDAERTRLAEQAVAQAEIADAVDLFNAGRREEAREALRRIAEGARDRGTRSQAQGQLLALGEAEVAEEEIEAYNQAVAAANRGDLEQASAGLQALIRTAGQEELRDAAASLLADVQALQHGNRLVRRFNRAIDKARNGELDEAIALLESILDERPDDELALETRRMLDELRP